MTEQEENLLPDDCQICFEKIGEDYITLDCCGQDYHIKCIEEWLKVSKYKTCPHCRKKIKDYEKTVETVEQTEVSINNSTSVREINKNNCICCCRGIIFFICLLVLSLSVEKEM